VSRVACETLVTTGLAIRRRRNHDQRLRRLPGCRRATINEIGYNRGKYGFDGETCAVLSSIHSQSPDIAMGVGHRRRRRSGLDVRLRAAPRHEKLMPLPIMLGANKLAKGCRARARARLDYLRPDGKSQVTGRIRRQPPARASTPCRIEPAQPARHPGDDEGRHRPRRSSTA
jgi:S-adenosylmethionine synthetase